MDFVGRVADLVDVGVRAYWPGIVLAVLAVASREWRVASRPPRLPRLATRYSPLAILGLSLAASLTTMALRGAPIPFAHDDFSYLLGADTFAHGRIANPPAPAQFQTFHVLVDPYVSKYPPGTALAFAVAQLLTGLAILAAVALAAAASVAVWWAVRGWTSDGWAVVGGVLTAIHPTMVEWSQSYNPGALAAFAGALVVGAIPRGKGWVAGVGLAVLAITRPFEGLVLAAACLVLVRRSAGILPASPPASSRQDAGGPAGWKPALPIALLAVALFAAYNARITGHPLRLAYSVYEERFNPMPLFAWQKARPLPAYPNAEMERVYRISYLRRMDMAGAPDKKLYVMETAVFPRACEPLLPLLYIPLLALPFAGRKAWWIALALVLFSLGPFSLMGWLLRHYPAPATALVVILLTLLTKRVTEWRPLLGAAVIGAFAITSIAGWWQFARSPNETTRSAMLAQLERLPGKHHVIVPEGVNDLVYNEADLQNAKVIWSHGPVEAPGRTRWIIDGSSGRPRLRPLP